MKIEKTILNANVNFYSSGSYKEELVAVLVTDLDGLGDGWSYNFGQWTSTGFIKLMTAPIKPFEDIDDNGKLKFTTDFSRTDIQHSVVDYDTGDTLKRIYEQENSPDHLKCYSADTENTLQIDSILFGLQFWKDGEETISKSKWDTGRTFIYTCDADIGNDEIRLTIAPSIYMAKVNKIGCLRC